MEAAQYMFTSTFPSLFSSGLTFLLCPFEVGGTVGLHGPLRGWWVYMGVITMSEIPKGWSCTAVLIDHSSPQTLKPLA